MTSLVPVGLMGLAAAVAMLSEPAGGRLGILLPGKAAAAPVANRPPGELDARWPRGACLLGAGAVVLVAPGPVGLLLAVGVAVCGPAGVRRLQQPAWLVEDEAAAQDLPLALDLLASCLSGGAPLERAVAAVAAAVPGPCGRRLGSVATALAVGSPPAEAWQRLAGPARPEDLAAGGRAPPAGDPAQASGGPAQAAARALARASEGGAPVAAAVSRIAASARADAAAAASRAARRAGVLAVGPLGLCFLPAFVLLGVVPAVIGLAAPLLRGL